MSSATKTTLDARQMAQFVTDGFLLLEGFVPEEMNAAVYGDQQDFTGSGFHFWDESKAIRDVFAWEPVAAIIRGLVGEAPAYHHSFLHTVAPHHREAQNWHQDALIDTRAPAFDIQAFYFSHDTPKAMGPTLVLPGSHLRRASYLSIARYRNFCGQRHLEGPAGTIAFTHQDIWHCAQPNKTDRMRYMFKLRLQPTARQRGLFDVTGHDDPSLRRFLVTASQAWYGDQDRGEIVERAKLWRYVTGDDTVPTDYLSLYLWEGH